MIAPNGGETFYTGTSTNIQWSRVNYSGNLKIELLDGESVVQLLANNIPAVNESWSWAIADNQSVGTTFKIRISDVEDGEPMDESDGFFAIATASNPTIKVLSPNGGEVITQGVTYDITWSTVDYQGTVLIELLTSTKK